MKKKLLQILLFIFSVTVFGQAKTDSTSYKLDEYFTALTNLKKFNGNVIISKSGQVLLDKTYNIEGETDSLRVNKNSKFIIASVSKVFIKFSILKLAELKKIQVTDKLNKFIPDFPNGEKITVEQLIHHQSGLPRELTTKDSYDSLSLAKIVELAKLEKLQFEPGSQTLYSNVGYFLLHYIIDKSSSNGYLAFIQKEIFDQMKLHNTLEFNSPRLVPQFALGFDKENGKLIPTSIKKIKKAETGNYLSSIEDLYSFSNQILLGKALKKSLAIEMFGHDSLIDQSGGRSGYRSYFYKNLKTEVTFIFLSNYTDIPFQDVTTDVIKILDNRTYEVPHKINREEIQLPTETLKKYTGKFALEADLSQTFSIELIDNTLFQVDTNGDRFQLHPDSENTFFENPTTKDGFIFTYNKRTDQYDLTIVSGGINLEMRRQE